MVTIQYEAIGRKQAVTIKEKTFATEAQMSAWLDKATEAGKVGAVLRYGSEVR